ncbi:MAG: PIN domain-containing protein [Rhodocyclaceae bacterium]|nr:PIN domain-containing protein [Rhodocyclaceae bacterium]MBX3667015.1 PIN domain-containing protein [Rhodocyclaceae bacterium]
MFALDTNTISYYFRGEATVVTHMHALSPAHLAVPAIVAHELRFGLMCLAPAAALPRLTALVKLLGALRILEFDDACAQIAASLRARLEAQGTPIGPHDILIAATALHHGATLVTRNVAEFSLQVSNWMDSLAA